MAAASVLLASASAANADYIVGSPAFDAAVAASVAHWGTVPCGGDITYGWAPLPAGVLGYAAWTRPASEPADPSRFSSCHIDLAADIDLSPERFCTVVAHEIGHLHGHAHAEDPGDLMAEALGDPLPECVTAMKPYMPAGAAVAAVDRTATSPISKPKSSKSRTRGARPGKRTRRNKPAGSQRRARSAAQRS